MIDTPIAPPTEITIVKTERHNVREEAIERVARQLCLAAGCDPDANIQCGANNQCTLMFIPYPADRAWNAYRGAAEKMLKDAFQ